MPIEAGRQTGAGRWAGNQACAVSPSLSPRVHQLLELNKHSRLRKRRLTTHARSHRLLSHHIHAVILNPTRLPAILLIIRTNLFPNNSLGPGRVPPTAEEALEIKRTCAAKIIVDIPDFVREKLFASVEPKAAARQVEDMLDIFGDVYLNKHLVFAIVDLVFLRLFPEMERQSISSLLDEGDE